MQRTSGTSSGAGHQSMRRCTQELSEAEEIEIRRELDHAGVDIEPGVSANGVSAPGLVSECVEEQRVKPDERRVKARDTVYALQQRT